MQHEEDTCRICSAPAEEGAPLFHPCKCSGTIRYIHQDCLTTWLAHSKKKSCDVCKYQYSFTKVYSPNMPKQLPFILFLRKFAKQLALGALFILRGAMVALIWLAFLPYVTVWTWRFYFIVGDNVAWWVNDRARPPQSPLRYYPFLANVSVVDHDNATDATMLSFAHGDPLWRAVSSDIFTGQIIASLIVLAFLAVFLLREWIMQNARPGVFDDEVQPELEAPDGQRGEPVQVRDAQAEPQIAAPPAENDRPDNMPYIADTGEIAAQAEEAADTVASSSVDPSVGTALDINSGQQSFVNEEWHTILDETWGTTEDQEEPDSQHSPRRRRLTQNSDSRRHRDRDMRHHRHHSHFRARQTHVNFKGKGKSTVQHREDAVDVQRETRENGQCEASMPTDSYQFTFRLEPVSPSTPSSSRTAVSAASPPASTFSFAARPEIEDRLKYTSPTQLPYPITASTSSENLASPSASTSTAHLASFARRPPLFQSAEASAVDSEHPKEALVLTTPTPRSLGALTSGLPSPSLALYQAPEELYVAGPSQPIQSTSSSVDDGKAAVGVPSDDCAEAQVSFEKVEATLKVVEDNSEEDQENLKDLDIYFTPPTPAREGEADSDGEDADEDEGWEDIPDAAEEAAVDPNREVIDVFVNGVAGRVGAEDGGAAGALGGVRIGGNDRDGADAGGGENGQEGERRDGREEDVNEEGEGVQDEDMDGVLEAIGMRGPVTTVFQNAALMIFVLDTTIGLGIWLPFTIGKTFALLTQEPLRILQIIHFPIRLIRFVTDPFVDLFFLLGRQLTMPLINMIWWLTRVAVNKTGLKDLLFSAAESCRSRGLLEKLKVDEIHDFVEAVRGKGMDILFSTEAEPSVQESAFVRQFSDALATPIGQDIEHRFAILGKHVRLSSLAMKDTWIDLANGDATINKVFAVVLGYLIVGLVVALYLNVMNVGSMQSAGRAVRNAIRQQLIVVKVAVFILIELVVFPLGCGIMLDICTLQLFPDTSIDTRLMFFKYAPVTVTFYHWMSGTMFMYQFAVLLAGCRSIMRPGAMWFIKDPQDQNFHPIRDILDRPTLVQLRKLAISAVMYAVVVACGVGCATFFINLWGKTLLPLRWKMREPLSKIPFDLLFLHIVAPPTLHHFRPRKFVRKVTDFYWRWAARQLRLTSYMFGGEYPEETQFVSTKDWLSSFWRKPAAPAKLEFKGSFRRVPAEDNIALPKELRATVAVDKNGDPLDDAGRRLMERQNAEAEKARRVVSEDYTIVYLPPHFRYRVILFIVGLWLAFSVVLVSCIAAPIHVGRAFSKLVLNREVHDAYSITIGFYLFWGCFFIGKTLDRMDKSRQRIAGDGPRGEWPVYVAKRALLWAAKFTWIAFWLGFVIPTLIGVIMEVYLVLPLRLMLVGDAPLRVRVFESWAVGLMYTKMALGTMRYRPETRIDAAITRLKQHGLRRPDAWNATVEIIAPVTAGLTAMLVAPMLSTILLHRFVPAVGEKALFFYVYPGIFVVAAIVRAIAAFRTLCGSWAQSIRDSEFLVEMQLKNLESNIPPPTLTSIVPQIPQQVIETASSHTAAAAATDQQLGHQI